VRQEPMSGVMAGAREGGAVADPGGVCWSVMAMTGCDARRRAGQAGARW
jgi:hypothetical protein